MSLHVELSPEALERLRVQRRNSTISSCLVAFLSVVLIGLILGFFLLQPMDKNKDTVNVTVEPGRPIVDPPQPPKVRPSLERKPSPPSAYRAKVLAPPTMSDLAIPTPDVDVATPSLNFGDGDDFGNMGGDSLGPGGDFIKLPPTMDKRCSKPDRLDRLRETGGSPECEEAVVKALHWMKGTQRPDGSWGPQYPAAMTGLALLAYLGHCETPLSNEFGETVGKAISHLVNIGLKNQGRLTSTGSMGGHQTVYEHAICTYALAEAYTLCKGFHITIPDLDVVTGKATAIILDGQGESGGWVYGYAPTNGGDNSVGFWQIQALKAAKHTGLLPDERFTKASQKALDFIGSVQGPNGAVGYRSDPNVSPQLTGGAVLCFQLWDKGNAREARNGVRYLKENTSFEWGTPGANLYYHYYHTQAMMNEGGSAWRKYNSMFRDELLTAQNSDGSWTQTGIRHGPINQHMATCLATLMLEVYYRFLPGTGIR